MTSLDGKPLANLKDFNDRLEDKNLSKGLQPQILRDGVKRFVFIEQGR